MEKVFTNNQLKRWKPCSTICRRICCFSIISMCRNCIFVDRHQNIVASPIIFKISGKRILAKNTYNYSRMSRIWQIILYVHQNVYPLTRIYISVLRNENLHCSFFWIVFGIFKQQWLNVWFFRTCLLFKLIFIFLSTKAGN